MGLQNICSCSHRQYAVDVNNVLVNSSTGLALFKCGRFPFDWDLGMAGDPQIL